jgi:hypothetical protein
MATVTMGQSIEKDDTEAARVIKVPRLAHMDEEGIHIYSRLSQMQILPVPSVGL